MTPVMYSDISGYAPEWLCDIGRFVGGTAIAVLSLAITVATLPLLLIPGAASVPLFSYNMMLYGAALMASPVDKNIKTDMKKINWNPFNNNTSSVVSSNTLSFYKGTFVMRYGKKDGRNRTGFSFGIIALERDASSYVLKHEYGHHKQQRLLGIGLYTTIVAGPSLFSFYTSNSIADHQGRWYEQWATDWGNKGVFWW
jgi:hypothetical protein